MVNSNPGGGWVKVFYPGAQTEKTGVLRWIFNYVEIDSTFYNIPSELMVKNWNRRTPDNFRFLAKFPKIITHEKKFKNVEKEFELFYSLLSIIR